MPAIINLMYIKIMSQKIGERNMNSEAPDSRQEGDLYHEAVKAAEAMDLETLLAAMRAVPSTRIPNGDGPFGLNMGEWINILSNEAKKKGWNPDKV